LVEAFKKDHKEVEKKVSNLLNELKSIEQLEKMTKKMGGVRAEVYSEVEKLDKLLDIATKINVDKKRV